MNFYAGDWIVLLILFLVAFGLFILFVDRLPFIIVRWLGDVVDYFGFQSSATINVPSKIIRREGSKNE